MKRRAPITDPYAAWDSGHLKRAFVLFTHEAEAGDANAQLNLGYFYDVGLGTKQSQDKAMQWYRRAYRNGLSVAASNIATVYRDNGQPRLAFAWDKRAACMKDGDAMVEVAKRYLSGSGVRRNYAEARRLLKRAVVIKYITEAGREEAQELLAGQAWTPPARPQVK